MRNWILRGVLSASLVAATAWNVQAADLVEWANSGEWRILIDPSTGNGCLMQKTLTDGTVVEFGEEPIRSGGFLAAYNPSWTDILEGTKGTVRFEFDDAVFEGEVEADVVGPLHGGRAFFDNPNLPLEFAKRRSMTVIGERGRRIEIDLSGTSAAIASVRACQKKQPSPAGG